MKPRFKGAAGPLRSIRKNNGITINIIMMNFCEINTKILIILNFYFT